MKISTKINDKQVEVSFELQGQEWKKQLDKSFKQLHSELELKGFRKGNVPLDVAKQRISDDEIRNKAVNIAIDHYIKDIETEIFKNKIITRPRLSIEKISDSELGVKFISELYPEIKIGDTSKIKLKLAKEKVTKEEVDAQLNQIQGLFKDLKPKTGPAKKGDTLNIDFVGKHNGKEFDGGTAKNHNLKLGSKSFVDNFEDQLIGIKKDEEKTIKVTFPKVYPEKKLAGQEVEFYVKVNAVNSEVELEGEHLNQKLSSMGFKSKDDLKEKITKMIEEQKTQQSQDLFFNNYTQEVMKLKDSKIDVPNSLIEQELENEVVKFEQQLEQQQMTLNKYLQTIKLEKEEFKEKNLKPKVKQRIIDGLIYQELINKYKIKVDDKDLEVEYKNMAKLQGMKVEDIKKQIAPENLSNSLQFTKLITKLSSN